MNRLTRLTTLILLALNASILAASAAAQVDPDDRCDELAPALACIDPEADPEAAALIVWVLATDEGVSIYLTPEGVDHGRSCDGAGELVELASDAYATLPAETRLRDDLLWANPILTREIFAHAWAATLGSDRGNPVDVVFADYIGDAESFQSSVYTSPALAALCPG